MSPGSARTTAIAAALTALALGLAAWLVLDARNLGPLEISGYVLAAPRELPAVELVDEHDAPFRSGNFTGHWSFLYFGYTYCPDVCPLTLVELAKLKQQLAADGVASSWLEMDQVDLSGVEVPEGGVPLGVLAIGRGSLPSL